MNNLAAGYNQPNIDMPNVNPNIDLGNVKTKTLMTTASIENVSPSPTNMKLPNGPSIFEDTKDRRIGNF